MIQGKHPGHPFSLACMQSAFSLLSFMPGQTFQPESEVFQTSLSEDSNDFPGDGLEILSAPYFMFTCLYLVRKFCVICVPILSSRGFPDGLGVKNRLPVQETQETWVWSLSQKNPLEKEMATHPSIPAWKIPWTEEPGRLLYVELQRVRHGWAAEHMHTHQIHI